MAAEPTVFVVDDDAAVRESLAMLLESAGLRVESYVSAREFLAEGDLSRPGCLILDIRMPGLSGLDLQDVLVERGVQLPVIMLTGHGDVPAAVRAMRGGAVDFLEKPFDSEVLLERIRQAFERDAELRRDSATQAALAERLSQLTQREREIMELIVAGNANKVIALDLDISERTVELHRARIMRKMGARSLAELMRMVLSPETGGGSAERA